MPVCIVYSKTSMARTYLVTWKFIRDIGSSSYWWLIIEPGKEANGDNLGKIFLSSIQ